MLLCIPLNLSPVLCETTWNTLPELYLKDLQQHSRTYTNAGKNIFLIIIIDYIIFHFKILLCTIIFKTWPDK